MLPVQDDTIVPRPITGEACTAAPKRLRTTERLFSLMRELAIGLVLTALLIWAKVLFEESDNGRDVALFTYDFLQGRLRSKSTPVVVVDVSGVPWKQVTPTRALVDRLELLKVVQRIALKHPSAIGIDIDFSPDYIQNVGFVYHDKVNDPTFFSACLRIGKTVPVFLGCYLNAGVAPNLRFIAPAYSTLARGITVRDTDDRIMPVDTVYTDSGIRLEAISQALGATPADNPIYNRFPSWFANARLEHSESPGFASTEVLVDFSPIAEIASSTIKADSASSQELQRADLAGKIVLLGLADPTRDESFAVAGHRRAYPGVYLHACATHTVVQGPLYELTPAGRVVIDFAFSMFVLGGVFLYKVRRPEDHKDTPEKLPKAFTFLAVVVALFVGAVWINATRVIWDDFLMVIAGLLIHANVEPILHHLRIRRRLPRAG